MKRIVMMSMILMLMISSCAQIKNVTSGVSAAPEAKPSPRYLEFADILIPSDLERVGNECVLTNGYGKLVVSGRVERESLTQFFTTSMNSEGWVALNQYKYGNSVKLFFKKQDKFADILIEENALSTKVEIWVVPQEKI